VVHNDARELTATHHPFTLYAPTGETRTFVGPVALAEALAQILVPSPEVLS
jgi:hypothetical protein